MGKQRLWTGVGASLGMLVLILDGKTALEGAQQGIDLCLRTVVPSLFPFFLLSILLTGAFLGSNLPVLRPLGRLFGIPGGAESILISAFLGGYPVGAQSVAAAYRAGQLDKSEAERMLAFCSNAGPAFLFGMAASLFPRKWMAWALWGIHFLSAFLVSRLFPGPETAVRLESGKPVSLPAAMTASVRIMAAVCGWVILFRVLIAFLSRWILWLLPTAVQVAIMGMLELSNGCCALGAVPDISLRFVICSVILAFGGLCVSMQTMSVTKGLSLSRYFAGKLLQTVFSLILAAAVVWQLWAAAGGLTLFFLIFPEKIRKKGGNPLAAGV